MVMCPVSVSVFIVRSIESGFAAIISLLEVFGLLLIITAKTCPFDPLKYLHPSLRGKADLTVPDCVDTEDNDPMMAYYFH